MPTGHMGVAPSFEIGPPKWLPQKTHPREDIPQREAMETSGTHWKLNSIPSKSEGLGRAGLLLLSPQWAKRR